MRLSGYDAWLTNAPEGAELKDDFIDPEHECYECEESKMLHRVFMDGSEDMYCTNKGCPDFKKVIFIRGEYDDDDHDWERDD